MSECFFWVHVDTSDLLPSTKMQNLHLFKRIFPADNVGLLFFLNTALVNYHLREPKIKALLLFHCILIWFLQFLALKFEIFTATFVSPFVVKTGSLYLHHEVFYKQRNDRHDRVLTACRVLRLLAINENSSLKMLVEASETPRSWESFKEGSAKTQI